MSYQGHKAQTYRHGAHEMLGEACYFIPTPSPTPTMCVFPLGHGMSA